MPISYTRQIGSVISQVKSLCIHNGCRGLITVDRMNPQIGIAYCLFKEWRNTFYLNDDKTLFEELYTLCSKYAEPDLYPDITNSTLFSESASWLITVLIRNEDGSINVEMGGSIFITNTSSNPQEFKMSTISENNEVHPFTQLKTVMQSDPEYAWGYHCNLAVPIMDVTGVSHYDANSAAALIMMQMFEVDITKHEHYPYKKSPVQEYYELRVESEREEDEKSSDTENNEISNSQITKFLTTLLKRDVIVKRIDYVSAFNTQKSRIIPSQFIKLVIDSAESDGSQLGYLEPIGWTPQVGDIFTTSDVVVFEINSVYSLGWRGQIVYVVRFSPRITEE